MSVLPSRKYPSPEDFVRDFLTTLTPGVIPRQEFIDWAAIDAKMQRLSPLLEFFAQLRARMLAGNDFVRELADCLLSSDDPLPYILCAFELLAHTHDQIATRQDDLDFPAVATAVQAGNEGDALNLAQLLADVGFARILTRDRLEDMLLGVQLGLETHRRKNVGGRRFNDDVLTTLATVAAQVRQRGRTEFEVTQETVLRYGTGLSKKVDFALHVDGHLRFGVEVNFYTTTGSKPADIKRSYGNVLAELAQLGTDLIWITDGKGYRGMKRSLRDAYVILPNIYNLNQAREHLAHDLAEALG